MAIRMGYQFRTLEADEADKLNYCLGRLYQFKVEATTHWYHEVSATTKDEYEKDTYVEMMTGRYDWTCNMSAVQFQFYRLPFTNKIAHLHYVGVTQEDITTANQGLQASVFDMTASEMTVKVYVASGGNISSVLQSNSTHFHWIAVGNDHGPG